MAYLSDEEVKKMNFEYVGSNVKISDKACIYDSSKISIGDNSRIDDLCVISGRVSIGNNCHVTPMCLIAGGEPGVEIRDYCTLAYGVKIFAQSDDYSGESMVNSLIPKQYKNEKLEKVILENHCVLGANCVVMPGVSLAEGTSGGAVTLFRNSTSSWGVYVGSPAQRIKERSKRILKLVKIFEETKNDTI
ncbi:Acyltransferase [Vibrio crassostreae]|nr:Acyltransferase [Vibrio crassostreae]CAK2313928.1 Acyltransferase [Vibrio crassostreae]CAK2451136.1 Acyltransferase [Vibrio crassostreae]CAK2771027.1 Acyltransferase [Vibrio crassostreae]